MTLIDVPIWIFGIPLPVVALHETLSAANALLEHANLALPEAADRLVRWVFVTPNMHKWHHSRDARETDTNYGNILSIWDRIFARSRAVVADQATLHIPAAAARQGCPRI